jgi:lysophospholipase L1-like esterase
MVTKGRWIALIAVVAVLAAAALVSRAVVGRKSGGSPAAVPLPRSMASAGDSITRAFDLDAGHFLRDTPADSWSTGSDPAVGSQYDRLLAPAPAISGHAFNDARSGAQMVALDGQLQAAGAQRVDYLTVLMGANDLCTPTVAAMTPAATFQAQFDQALSGFLAADPGAHVLVASIPDLYRLWQTLQANPAAQLVWGLARICPSMLAGRATAADRQAVVAREQADNAALASVCARFRHCRFDGGAVYRAAFSAADVSSVDYFHPSLAGQAHLAAITWAAGYWPTAG